MDIWNIFFPSESSRLHRILLHKASARGAQSLNGVGRLVFFPESIQYYQVVVLSVSTNFLVMTEGWQQLLWLLIWNHLDRQEIQSSTQNDLIPTVNESVSKDFHIWVLFLISQQKDHIINLTSTRVYFKATSTEKQLLASASFKSRGTSV